jgi:hypothetical protein
MSGYGNLSDGRRPNGHAEAGAASLRAPRRAARSHNWIRIKLQDVGLATCRGTALRTFRRRELSHEKAIFQPPFKPHQP